MKVTLVRSAGLIPVVTETVVDTATLAPEHAASLEERVRDAGILEAGGPDSRAAGASIPDAVSYRLTVDDGQRRRTLDLEEPGLAPGVRSLIDCVIALPGRVESVRPIGRR